MSPPAPLSYSGAASAVLPAPPDAAVADAGQADRRHRPIGVFDSGIGGLTVVAALRRLLPAEDIFYLGDTARVPYGGRSAATIERYSFEISGLLLAEGAKVIVVACNTASALALPRLQETLRVPVIGVIAPGAAAALTATRTGRIGVIGTRATVRSGAYERALRKLSSAATAGAAGVGSGSSAEPASAELEIQAQACPLLVPLIEEGWLDDPVTDQTIRRYLQPLLDAGVDTLILGCTHYPLLRPALARVVGAGVEMVDSAHNCALAVRDLLRDTGLAAPEEGVGRLRVALTDAGDGFLRVAERALDLPVGEVELRTVQGVAPGGRPPEEEQRATARQGEAGGG